MGYSQHLTATPQTEPIVGREAEMSKNAAGGYAFDTSDWTRLDRFLILGSEGGTYYVGEGKLTRENASGAIRAIREDGLRAVARILEVSDRGLAPKNDPAVFALALAAKTGDEATRRAAFAALPAVCRIGTHLFQFCEAIDALGGWGRGARRAVGRWYTEREPESLAYQVVKYRQRGGWTHRDALRLAHPRPEGPSAAVISWAAGKWNGEALPAVIAAFEEAQRADLLRTAALIREHNLPREAVSSEMLDRPEILEALLERMPIHAMIRNLGNLTKAGILSPFSDGSSRVIDALSSSEGLRKSRVHPMAIYLALSTYVSGHGLRGSGAWTPVPAVCDALHEAFYGVMGNVSPSGKKLLIALDTSGSMGGGRGRSAVALESPIAKAAAMALISVKTERQFEVIGVDTGIQNLGITPSMRLDQAIAIAASNGGGGTDLSLPYRYLSHKGYSAVEGVVVYTDSETWAGRSHPAEALAAFRREAGHPVRNAVISMTATGHSIGDPGDPLTLQAVGLDASLPQTISAFLAGEF